jgi:FtsP/CotA-like multicopper oxidase with cupredoxin domain
MIIVVAAGSGLLGGAYAFHLIGFQQASCWARPTGPANAAIFTVVMANEGASVGFNGSKFQPSPWPVMNVTLGQNVIIHVINNDSVEAHGFQIATYFNQGLGQAGLAPGKCFDVRFVANIAGSFMVRCDISCAIHLFMQDGQLNVNP